MSDLTEEPPEAPQPETPTEPAPRPARRLGAVLSVVLSLAFLLPVCLLMPTAALPHARAGIAVRHSSFQLDNEEGALLYQAQQIRHGESIYRALDAPPYVAGTYTPLYMAAVAAFDDLTVPTFKVGRLIVWISAISCSILLMAMVLRLTTNIPLAMLSGLLFLATYEVYRWIGYFRVDFPALFLTLSGLFFFCLAKPGRGANILTALALVAGLYTKQSMIAAPAAVLLALAFTDRHRALAMLGWMTGLGMIPLIGLQVSSGGQFLKHIISYNMNTFSGADLNVWMRHASTIHRWMLVGAALAVPALIAIHFARRRAMNDAQEIGQPVVAASPAYLTVGIYAVLASWNILGAAKAGSAENYLLEPIAAWSLALCTATGAALALAVQPGISPRRGLTASCLAFSIAMFALVSMHTRFIRNPLIQQSLFSAYINPSPRDFQAANQVSKEVAKATNPLCELAIFNLKADKPPVLQPFIMSELARQGKWNQTEFVNQVRLGKFDLVVAQSDLSTLQAPIEYTNEMLAAFRQSYKLEKVIESPLWSYYLLVPKSPTDSSNIQIASR